MALLRARAPRGTLPPIQLRLSSLRSLSLRNLPPQGGKGNFVWMKSGQSSPLEARGHQLAHALRAVAVFAFVVGVHLAERLGVAERLEDRVVAEAAIAAFLVD